MTKARFTPLLLLLLMLAAPPVAQAQFTVGAYGLLNSAGLNGDTPEDFSYTGNTGFGFGLIGEFYLTDDIWLSVQPGIQPKGAGLEVELDDEEDPVKLGSVDLSYFSVPVLAKFVTVGGKVYVVSGVNFGFLTSAEVNSEEGDSEPVDIKDSLRSFDLALDFGVGGQLPVGKIKIMLEARYEQGLLNIVDETSSEGALRARVRSSGLELLAGILLPLGGGR
jgi:hypothetical protein